jgi:hypothetical protein
MHLEPVENIVESFHIITKGDETFRIRATQVVTLHVEYDVANRKVLEAKLVSSPTVNMRLMKDEELKFPDGFYRIYDNGKIVYTGVSS